jgi:hypothetical protein
MTDSAVRAEASRLREDALRRLGGKPSSAWEVWQGHALICSYKMGLTEAQARNKVENERRFGYHMEARQAMDPPGDW